MKTRLATLKRTYGLSYTIGDFKGYSGSLDDVNTL